MDKKQTAVEWLVDAIFNDVDLKDSILKLAISQAKEMEREQIIEAYRDGRTDQQTRIPKFYNRSSAIYYTSTYGE
jgi:hypothetical protein